MQVESLPAPVVVPEVPQPLPPPAPPPTEVSEPVNVSVPPASEEFEQPTFHVMQPPAPPVPIVPNESAAAPSSTTFTQLVAVPIASDTPIAPTTTITPTPVAKQTKRVCIPLCWK